MSTANPRIRTFGAASNRVFEVTCKTYTQLIKNKLKTNVIRPTLLSMICKIHAILLFYEIFLHFKYHSQR